MYNITKLETYKTIISNLQRNDSNGTYEEILESNDNNLKQSIRDLYKTLERIIVYDGLEDEELLFYMFNLRNVEKINY